MKKKLVIIDGMSIFYRGFFAMPGLSLPDGTPTGGVFGFASIAIEVIKQLKPDYVAVAWDVKNTSTHKRREIFNDYKAGRQKPPQEFYDQIPLLHQMLEAFGWPLYELENYEADDIMGTFSEIASDKNIKTCIVTGDYDMLQLLNNNVSVYITKKGSELLKFDEPAFEQKYGVKVSQFVDYKALVGDKSDNIPGVTGVGPKAAEKLLNQFSNLEKIYENLDVQKGALKTKLENSKDNAFMSKELANIFCDAPIVPDWHKMDTKNTDLAEVFNVLKKFRFESLIQRLPEFMQGGESGREHQINSLEIVNYQVLEPQIFLSEKCMLYQKNDEVFISPNKDLMAKIELNNLQKIVDNLKIITFGGGKICHFLLRQNIKLPDAIYDIKQMAFLLNPLERGREVKDVTGYDGDDVGQILARLWEVYRQQQKDLKELPSILSVAEKLDFPLIPILARMEYLGILIDDKFFMQFSKDLKKQVQKVEQQIYNMVDVEFNIGSPKQLSEILFTKLMLPIAGIKKGKTGYSTGQKELDKLRGTHPIIELIEEYREAKKLQNTYVDVLPELADDKKVIHTTFNQDAAGTGRLSSTDPNLQNIPIRTDLGKKVRQGFIPREGKIFVQADYSQFELRLVAVMSGDQQMIDDFNNGIDIHAKTASDVFRIELSEVTKEQRRAAKIVNFGVLYGMSPHGLSQASGMFFSEAKQFIDDYFAVRPLVKKYIDDTVELAKTQGFVQTLDGRRRPTPDIHSSNFIVRQSAERAAANMPIQGTEADLMKKAMIGLEKVLPEDAHQVLQVHDSILVECNDQDKDKVAKILQEIMQSVAPELPVKLDVDVTFGKHWNDL